MTEVFQRDIFSVSRPQFSPVSAAATEVVLRTARTCFVRTVGRIEDIRQFGGNEINSNNFKLVSSAGCFLLKRLPVTADVEVLRRQLALAHWLHGQDSVRVPPMVHADDDSLLCTSDGAHWCAFEFVAGDFFHGGYAELASTSQHIGRLQRALARHPAELTPPAKWSYATVADQEIFATVDSRRADWSELFGVTSARLLAQRWDHVRAVEQELRRVAELLPSLRVTACHCDLHPHNILMAGEAVTAFIDFESFTTMPVAAALGFATYKLVRQHAVAQSFVQADRERVGQAAGQFIAGLRSSMGAADVDPGTLRLMALAEIFRRLLMVFRLNVRDHDARWNHVLPMHLSGFDEIELMFDAV